MDDIYSDMQKERKLFDVSTKLALENHTLKCRVKKLEKELHDLKEFWRKQLAAAGKDKP